MADNFYQIDKPDPYDVFIIWNSSNSKLSPKKIDVHCLSTIPPGFPFGLIIEHSGVFLENNTVFQKASPHEIDKFEIIKTEQAFSPYEKLPWKQITYHRKKN